MKRFAISLFAAAALIAGCGSDDSTFFQANNNNNNNNTPQGRSLKQIEQLARPGINEALLFTNAFLNAYNGVSPAFIKTALTVPNSPEANAAGPIFAEAIKTLTAFQNVNAGAAFSVNKSVSVFLPDVMRVDSSLFIAGSAYATLSPVNNFPTGGRKLLDDVIDITYFVVLGPVSDNVTYVGTPGNPATGHQPLEATFPYLAPAN